MFHPNDRPMDRGWVGRVDGDTVVHLAAQTLQHFFTGGGGAREHAEYPLAEVTLLVPVLQPPNVRLFEDETTFAFGNATAIAGDRTAVPRAGTPHSAVAHLAAMIGAEGAIGGYTGLIEWRADAASAKANDFALVLGPILVTDLDPAAAGLTLVATGGGEARGTAGAFAWEDARALAARGTELRPGDLLVGPVVCALDGVTEGDVVLSAEGIGALRSSLVASAG